MTIEDLLTKLGFNKKEIAVYLALLSLGPSPVRKIASEANVNRGTTYDALKSFQKEGLVSYYHKEKHQYFVAEDPLVLNDLLKKRKEMLQELEISFKGFIPQLRSLYSEIEERPVVKYYEGPTGIRTILQDVLDSTEALPKKEYVVYSSSNIRPYLYERAYPNFTEERIKRKIFVKVIAIGAGGKEAGYDERRWLTKKGGAPTYTIIYAGKVAMISVRKDGIARGVIIEDQYLFETQKLLFDWIWSALK